MEQELRTKLLATAALASLVGTRIDWGARPQGAALPAVVLHLIGSQPDLHMAGPGSWTETRVQADCWATTFKAARDVAATLVTALHGFRGDMGALRVRCRVLSRRADSDGSAETVLHRTMIDLRVWHALQPGASL